MQSVCLANEKKSHDKVYPKGYVEMLENQQAQLVTGLQELYKRTQKGQGWAGAPLKESSNGQPLTHDILERLGALKQEGHAAHDTFEEDLAMLQQRLIADGAGFMQRQASHDSHSSSSTPSPIYEPLPQRPNFTNPFTMNQYPPSPPNHSPFPNNARMVQAKQQRLPHAATNPSNLGWSTPLQSDFDDSMDFMGHFDPSNMMDSSVDLSQFPPTIFQDQIVPAGSINPCLTMKDWAGQDDLPRYFNPQMI